MSAIITPQTSQPNNTPQSLSLLSPAKLNLMLHITGRRADGYHQLQTLFQLLDYGDTLHFSLREDARIELTPAIAGVADADNLITRAALALRSYSQKHSQHHSCGQNHNPRGVDIKLEKRLPMGGGIGGGSSNAATTLLALNTLWQTGLTIDELAQLGLQLGADVPVFVRGHSAWAEGIGEQLQAVNLPERWFCVLKPTCEVSTHEIFSHKQLTRDSSPITMAAVFEQGGFNDCQSVVRQLYPEVDFALDWLDDRISQQHQSQLQPKQLPLIHQASLTGTGACVFAAFTDYQSARQILDKLPSQLQGFVAKGVNISASHTALNL